MTLFVLGVVKHGLERWGHLFEVEQPLLEAGPQGLSVRPQRHGLASVRGFPKGRFV